MHTYPQPHISRIRFSSTAIFHAKRKRHRRRLQFATIQIAYNTRTHVFIFIRPSIFICVSVYIFSTHTYIRNASDRCKWNMKIKSSLNWCLVHDHRSHSFALPLPSEFASFLLLKCTIFHRIRTIVPSAQHVLYFRSVVRVKCKRSMCNVNRCRVRAWYRIHRRYHTTFGQVDIIPISVNTFITHLTLHRRGKKVSAYSRIVTNCSHFLCCSRHHRSLSALHTHAQLHHRFRY